MASLSLAFDILARDKGASATFKDVGAAAEDAGQKGQRFGGLMKAGMAVAATAVATIGVAAVAGMRSAISEASNLGESVNAVNVVFGDAAGGVLKLSENAAKAVGLSRAEFNGLAVQFSNFAQTVAGPSGDVTKTLEGLTGRAADFASVMNLDVAEAASLFQSGLAGETEPLRKFGIDLSAAAVEAYAYANGIAESGKTLTENEKVQARYGLLMQSTAKTQGDFANTSDSLANRQRILGATFDNIKAKVGTGLLPVMEGAFGFILDSAIPAAQSLASWFGEHVMPRLTDFGGVLRDEVMPRLQAFGGFVRDEVVPRLQEFGGWLSANKDTLVTVGGVVLATMAAVQGYTIAVAAQAAVTRGIVAVTTAWNTIQAVLNGTLALNPIGIVVAALIALGAALFVAYQKSETFRNIVDSAWKTIREAVATAWENYIKPAFTAIAGFVQDTLIPAIQWLWQRVIVPAFQGIAAVIGWAWNNVIQPLFRAWWAYIQNVLIPVIQWLWNNVVKPVFEKIGGAIKTAWESVIKPAFDGLAGIVKTLYDRFITARTNVGKFIDKIKGFKLPDWVQKLVDAVKTIGDGIGGAVGGVARFFGAGDAPAAFRGTAIGGGRALARVQSVLPRGLAISSTYRSPAQNRAVGGHPTSLHMDRANPAVDIAGPTGLLDRFAAQLAAMGGWRQLLWRVAGHYDHIHVAHSGGMVSAGWPRMPGDRWDERTARLQVGERVQSRAEVAAGGGGGRKYELNIANYGRRQVTASDLLHALDAIDALEPEPNL